MIIIIALAFGAMWLMTNRTRKQQRAAGDFRANLEVGNEVMTGSGLYGTIVAIDDDTITLESTPGNESRWIRAAISKLIEPPVVDEGDEYEDATEDEDATDEYGADEYEDDVDDVAREAGTPTTDAAGHDAATDRAAEHRAVEETKEQVIEVPDDLSSLPSARKDEEPDKK